MKESPRMRGLSVILVGGLLALSGALARADGPTDAAASIGDAAYRQVHVLAVGINDYLSPGIRSLSYAEKDARDVAAMLANRFGYRTETLLGREATRKAIMDRLQGYEASLHEDDALIVFFAGHGQNVSVPDSFGQTGFLVPYDANLDERSTDDFEDWTNRAIDMREIASIAKRIRSRHVLLIADVCFSGFLGRRSGLASRPDLVQLMRMSSRMVMTAGTEDQEVVEPGNLGHGLFTHFLLQELGRVDAASASEVFTPIHLAVKTEAARYEDHTQTPQLTEIRLEEGEFVFVAKDVADVRAALFAVDRRAADRHSQRSTLGQLYRTHGLPDLRFAADVVRLEREWRDRLERYKSNAIHGDTIAMAGLALCYARGIGVDADPDAAFRWALRAYDSGDPAGAHVLAGFYRDGVGVVANWRAADRLLDEAAGAGFPLSKVELAAQELDNRPGADPTGETLDLLEQASREGVPEAKVRLARYLLDRPAPDESEVDRARKLLEESARLDEPSALHRLYRLLGSGEVDHQKKDIEAALTYLLKAADAGHAESQAALALEYYGENAEGRLLAVPTLGLKPKLDRARNWAELASRQGQGLADLILHWLHWRGEGVAIDHARGREYLERAIENRQTRALTLKGIYLNEGKVYTRDEDQAHRLLYEAAVLGDAMAMFELAYSYQQLKGVGQVPEDPDSLEYFKEKQLHHAFHWYWQAFHRGHPRANAELNRIRDLARLYHDFGEVARRLRQDYPETYEQSSEWWDR